MGKVIYDKKLIALNYIKNTFMYDLLVQIPLFLAYQVNEKSSDQLQLIFYLTEALIFFKFVSLGSCFHRIEKIVCENQNIAQIFPLIVLSVKIIQLAHIVGIIYNILAQLEIYFYNSTQTWIHIMEFQDSYWLDKYIHSVYWSVCTMVTILLYIPTTNIELVFSIIAIFLLTGVFGYALNTIGVTIQEIQKKKQEEKQFNQKVNQFFKKRNIPEKLRERITLYLDFDRQQRLEKNEEEEALILNSLSEQLKNESIKAINKENIQKFEFLFSKFSAQTQEELKLIIKEESYSPQEQIINNNNNQGISLYILKKGKAEIYIENELNQKKKKIFQINENSILGKRSFFCLEFLQYQVISIESCVLLRIYQSDFLKIVSQNPNDNEIFKMMQDQFLQDNQTLNIQQICSLCQDQHLFIQCDKCHLVVSKQNIIYTYRNLDTQLRSNFNERRQDKQIQTWDQLLEITEAQEEIEDYCIQDQDFLDLFQQYAQYYEDQTNEILYLDSVNLISKFQGGIVNKYSISEKKISGKDSIQVKQFNEIQKQDRQAKRKTSIQQRQLVNQLSNLIQKNQNDQISQEQVKFNIEDKNLLDRESLVQFRPSSFSNVSQQNLDSINSKKNLKNIQKDYIKTNTIQSSSDIQETFNNLQNINCQKKSIQEEIRQRKSHCTVNQLKRDQRISQYNHLQEQQRNSFTNHNGLQQNNILKQNKLQVEKEKSLEDLEWDFINFDLPKEYKFYMPYNNLFALENINNTIQSSSSYISEIKQGTNLQQRRMTMIQHALKSNIIDKSEIMDYQKQKAKKQNEDFIEEDQNQEEKIITDKETQKKDN